MLRSRRAGGRLTVDGPQTHGSQSPTGAGLLFEVFRQRYERGSILVTTNLPFDEWTEVFGSERLTGALYECPNPGRFRPSLRPISVPAN